MNRSQELTKNTLIITIGRVSTQFISFLLLPLYTSLLSKDEYGTVDLITTLVALIVPVTSLMIDQGVFRHLLNCKTDSEKKRTISSAIVTLCLSSIATLILYFLISAFVGSNYKIWLILILIATAFSNMFLQVARGLKKTTDYAIGSFVCSASIIVLNVLCIAVLHQGAVGMLIATFVGNVLCCIYLFFKLRVKEYISYSSFDKHIAIDELRYSIPLIPNQLSIWVMNSSDRLIVTFILGVAANGILAVSHKFPAIYLTFFNIFLLAWHETGAIHYFDEDRDVFFTNMFKKMVSIFGTLCMAIIVALPIVFGWFVNNSFHEAYLNIPIYLIASLFNVVVGILGVVYVATKRTAEIAKTTILAAVINIVVHVVLIKYVGLFAASISTFVGYGVTMITRIIDTKKYLMIKYDIKQFVCIGLALGICTYIYYLDNKVVSIVFLPFFLVTAYFFNRETVNELIKIIDQKIDGKINKKLFVAILLVVVVLVVAIAGLYIYRKVSTSQKEIQTEYKGEIKEYDATNIIRFSDLETEDFTCTGLSYDIKDDAFWIGDYGALNPNDKVKPRIVEVDRSLNSVLKTIDLGDALDTTTNLQGVAYDKKDDLLWLAIGDTVVAVNKDGSVVKTLNLDKYAAYKSNGICYDDRDDSLWILCASQYLLHIGKNGTVLGEYPFNYADQDHLCLKGGFLYITVGADYQGANNYVCKASTEDGSIVGLYRVSGSNAVEGICIIDEKMMIANDGLYHSDLRGISYLAEYDFNGFQ